MEGKPSTSSSCSSCSSSSYSSEGSKSKCCDRAIELVCSACLLCICCPLAIVWCVVKLPCKFGWRTVRFAMHRSCCGSEKKVFASYSSFSDLDSDTQNGKVERYSSSLGASKNRMVVQIWQCFQAETPFMHNQQGSPN